MDACNDARRMTWVVLALCVALVVHETAGAAEPTLRTEQQLAKYLQTLTTCKMLEPVYEDGSKRTYCTLQFRGLHVEFAGTNHPGGGTIYVYSLGKNQQLALSGQHCLTVVFKDDDLNFHDIGAHIFLMDDGTIIHRYDNQRAWRRCRGIE